MSVLFFLVIVSLCVAVVFLIIFIWAVRTGQFEDGYTPSVRMLFDHDNDPEEENEKPEKIKN